MTKRILSALLALAALLSVLAIPVLADETSETDGVSTGIGTPEVTGAQAALLYNFENDRFLYEYNTTETVYPASTVKIMTAVVVFDQFAGNFDATITVTQEMLNEVAGNRIGFSAGEVVTVEQMLYCMLVNSANDAAIILAHGTAGDTASFVKLMNDKAAWIGAYDTYYTNPTGLHDSAMVTTARDTAAIAKYAYTLPGFIEMTSTPKYVMEATNMSDYRNIYNRNCMISKYYSVDYYYSRAVGMNAGATTQGGYALCGVAEDPEAGLSYLAVVLGADGEDNVLYNYINTIHLFEWAFASYGYANVLSAGKVICEIPVNLSTTLDYVTLVPSKDIRAYLPTSVNVAKDIRYSYNTYSDSLDAPVEKGKEAGTITVLYGDTILGSCSLVTTTSITRSEFLHFLGQVKDFTRGRFFRGMIIGIVVLSILYALIQAALREKKLRRMSGRRR